MKRYSIITLYKTALTIFFFSLGSLFAEERFFAMEQINGSQPCGASSYLIENDDWQTYHAYRAFDGLVDTAWAEGAPDNGIGESIWFEVEEGLDVLKLTNGFARNRNLFLKNGRVKVMELQLWAGVSAPGMVSETGTVYKAFPASELITLHPEDSRVEQEFSLSFDWEHAAMVMNTVMDSLDAMEHCAYILCLSLADVYEGSFYTDSCIAELGWTIDAELSGPDLLRRVDLAGIWQHGTHPDWDRIEIEWYPFAQLWSAYRQGELYDSGSWYMGGGFVEFYSDGSGACYAFDKASMDGRTLILGKEEGEQYSWERE